MKFVWAAVIVLICVWQISAASRCQPMSRFKDDCNLCVCDSTGFEYICTTKKCPPRRYQNYERIIDENGRTIYIPKKHKPAVRYDDDDDDYILTKSDGSRQVRMPTHKNLGNGDSKEFTLLDLTLGENNDVSGKSNVDDLDLSNLYDNGRGVVEKENNNYYRINLNDDYID